MKRYTTLLMVLLGLALPLSATRLDVNKYAAGRIRFVDRDGVTFRFAGKTLKGDMDTLVLLGATFDTGKTRLELVALNGNTFWVDRDTDFHFESVDNSGDKTSLFLGKGAFVVETRRPMSVVTGAGSVYLPGEGRYLVMKNRFGKDKVYVTTLSGEKAVVLKKSTIINRIHLDKKSADDLVAWVEARKSDWRRTIARANIFSHVDKMPPFVAVSDGSGKVHWRKVDTVSPLYQANWTIQDNYFVFSPVVVHAMGLLTPATTFMTDYELALWFATNRYNSIRWAWNVEAGWHAEFYFDPLAGFGAQYAYPFIDASRFAYDWDWWFRGPEFAFFSGFGYGLSAPRSGGPYTGVIRSERQQVSRVIDVPKRGILTGVLRGSEGKPVVKWMTREARLTRRIQTDRAIESPRRAARLDVSERDLERARYRIARRNTTAVRRGTAGSAYRGSYRGTGVIATRPVTGTTVSGSASRISRAVAVEVKTGGRR